MKAIFLDRDGVINKYPGDKHYVTRWKDFRFLPMAKEAVARLSRKGFKVFIVSNQAGVGKGLYSKSALDEITGNMLVKLKINGGKVAKVYYCTHKPDANCPCRKPRAGLIRKARKEFGLGDARYFFIGDTMRDIITAQASGLRSILVLSGKERISNRKNWEAKPDFVFKNLYAAANFVLRD